MDGIGRIPTPEEQIHELYMAFQVSARMSPSTQGYFVDTEGNTFGIFEVYEQAGR
jgi:hypothetical protein